MTSTQDLHALCRSNLTEWSLVGGYTKAECFERLLDIATDFEDQKFLDAYEKYGDDHEKAHVIVDVEQVQTINDIDNWLESEYETYLAASQWDDIKFLLRNGVMVQCVSIIMTMKNTDAWMLGYLSFIKPNKQKSLQSLAETEEYFCKKLNSKQIKSRLEHGYEYSGKKQSSFDFYVNDVPFHSFPYLSTANERTSVR
jgi:hypothetical protein